MIPPMVLTYEQALHTVRERITVTPLQVASETVPLEEALGRVLAEQIRASRDYPPFDRSARDGYAVRSADVQGSHAVLECVGEVAAGAYFEGEIKPGKCAAIMTGAPLPSGADAVVMIEATTKQNERVEIHQAVRADENVVPKASEARAGSLVLDCGTRLRADAIGVLAANGHTHVEVFRKPRVAILPTGNELVSASVEPEWFQIRDSNASSLAAQVIEAGGEPWQLGIARDSDEDLKSLISKGLQADLLLVSGGVSVGKYDLVEHVLEGLGGEFYFRGASIRPGRPVVFGRIGEKFFFGLPGNPVSTLVTFMLFVRPVLNTLAGGAFEEPVFLRARLASPRAGKKDLTVFVPAYTRMRDGEPFVEPAAWQGSGDIVNFTAADCLMVFQPGQTSVDEGAWVDVLPLPR